MGGFPCYKLILCGHGGIAALRSLMEIGIEKSDEGKLTDFEFKQIVALMEEVEDKGNALVRKIAGLPASG